MAAITYVVPRYRSGAEGVETHVRELATRAAAAGNRVEVATQSLPGEPASEETIDGIAVRRFPGGLGFRGQSRVSRGLRAHVADGVGGADVLHVHDFHVPSSLQAVSVATVPTVFTPHYVGARPGITGRLTHRAYAVAARNVLPRARAIIHASQTESDRFFTDIGPLPSVRRLVVPDGVDLTMARTAVPYPPNGQLVVVAGRLEEDTQVHLAVAALAHLPDEVRLVIAGDGPDAESLRRLVGELVLGHRVTFTGALTKAEVFRWYRSADVVLSLARKECFGMTLLEGLAAGADVVATRIPAHVEAAFDAGYPTAGFVAERPTPEEVATAVAERLRGPKTGQWRVPSWDDVAARTLLLYDDLLGRRLVTR